ncbi:SulP family inorganic anion transporter [Celerinatantimonas yamalensis]|uniref:SulP family inorganic anion transporter n=1 Tax=Celerinatantimonas yamalensis TaxID=559956 RepID=A0ABW9G8P9_9GAMM
MFEFPKFSGASLRNDLLSGITVALALVPEAVAFAFVAGVGPLVGLYAAAIIGFFTAIFGGRPGMISGATGSVAVVIVALVLQHGEQYLFAAVVMMGIFQILAGVFRLGKFIRMVPHPVMLGFVNGLAIVIFLAQLGNFKVKDAAGISHWMSGPQLWIMLALVALTMAIVHFLPKLTKAIPASLAAIVIVTLVTYFFNLHTRTVLDFLQQMTGNPHATIAGGWPTFHIPDIALNWETIKVVIPYAFIMAGVGLIESLLTLTVIDEMTETRGRSNRECVGQGLANVVTGFFGGMGGCAMIGQSMINIRSGGRGRLSGLTAAVGLMCFILFASTLIEMIPIAALVGVMFMVVIATFEWSSLRLFNKIPKTDSLVIILVSVVTIFTDLATAVFVGVIICALVFAWKHAKNISVQTHLEGDDKIYQLTGPLFFSSVHPFLELFDVHSDPKHVIIDFANARVSDHSAIEAIDTLAERYLKANKQLHLRHLSGDCRKLLKKAGNLVEVNVIEDPHYHVADDALA